ncbi:putative damage-inducible protein DinB [Pedobacter africanus]|uniref:Damage-inducible protein DinB n=1 Tax=Pedobacter africanus TaxID=151894 RepID=A0ACC6KTZ5_9SPHI|nr:DUF1572 domain-containing protein [Pedobacter africanus]MDR6782603.1 putative damage-inducible protein DinB [Pedobacter africanus]
MSRAEIIADRLREVFLNGRWIANTNYKEQLSMVSWQQAIQKVSTLNTIAALTFHVNYYLAGVLKVLNGGALDIKDKYSFDLPEIKTEQDWLRLVNEFLINAEHFSDRVAQLSDETLALVFVEEKYKTWLRNVEAMIEHSYYHLGQITLIRKMIVEGVE